METERFEIEAATPFSESMIWELNRIFYEEKGISAWSDDIVPHHMTSNSSVGKTYAALILGLLKDVASKGNIKATVYILELGAGHGRLGFHILKHLQKLVAATEETLPPYCYVLSDIVEENIAFFSDHPQFQHYFQKGVLDVSYFDAINSKKIYLQKSQKTIAPNDLNQPLLAIANYFFDTIPNELFFIKEEALFSYAVSIHSSLHPEEVDAAQLIDNISLSYHQSPVTQPLYEKKVVNELLEDYRTSISDTYLFFPKKSMECLSNLKAFSKAGLVLLTMDKGFHELDSLKNKKEPDLVTHGSFSLWVNYHALSAFCTKQGGKALFPSFSNFHLEIGCLLFLNDPENYIHIDQAYNDFINDFGPDDFNSIKQLAYFNVSRLKLRELIALYRLSAYDSTIFAKLLPRLKHVSKTLTYQERTRLAQTMDCIWEMYFNINESLDLSYEIGGLFYDLGYYSKALTYFQHSESLFGIKADVSYNLALCYYQLRQDQQFYKILNEAKSAFPNSDLFKGLEKLDMK